MSGIKVSVFEVAQEWWARHEALSAIRMAQQEVTHVKARVESLLQHELPTGVKQSFPNEVRMAEAWCDKAKGLPHPSSQASIERLQRAAETCEAVRAAGLTVLASLVEIRDVRRGQEARKLAGQADAVRSQIHGLTSLGDRWFPQRGTKLLGVADDILSRVASGDFIQAGQALKCLRGELARFADEVHDVEGRDQQRSFVINSLQRACKDMGWGEVQAPKLVGADPRGDVTYVVETYSSGKLAFRITLDEVRAESGISSRICNTDFERLSGELRKYGVRTKFKHPANSVELPNLDEERGLDLQEADDHAIATHE